MKWLIKYRCLACDTLYTVNDDVLTQDEARHFVGAATGNQISTGIEREKHRKRVHECENGYGLAVFAGLQAERVEAYMLLRGSSE